MKYQFIDNYFDTPIFWDTVQHYFDTVLAALFADHAMTETKGRFVVDGIEKMDYYDMPYPVHILNGLIPTLKIYEQHLKNKNLLDNPTTEALLKVFMLGFTLHDANKLVRVPEKRGKSDLELALEQLHADVAQFRVRDFLNDFDDWQNEIFFLALGTENRTQVLANQYPLRRNEKFIRETLRPLCHLADSLASIQELESPGIVHESIARKLGQAESVFGKLQVSYVEVRPNPYTLTSQNLLQAARKVLAKNKKKVCFALRNGFVFFGEDATVEEREAIRKAADSASDLDPIGLTKVDAQQCEFGFLGSMPFTKAILENIEKVMHQQFLALSPNGPDKIRGFDDFVEFLKKYLSAFAPADQYINPVVDEKTGRLYLRFAPVEGSEEGTLFRQLVCLHKTHWLNGKKQRRWAEDFEHWAAAGNPEKAKPKKNAEDKEPVPANLPNPFHYADQEFTSLADVANYVEGCTNSASAILKTLLAIAKSWNVHFNSEAEPDESVARLQAEILGAFSASANGGKTDNSLIEDYFYCRGDEQQLLSNYQPVIHAKSEMCLFSGDKAASDYTDTVAFGVKARGFSNRTVTSLANTTSRISHLFLEENKLRISKFPQTDANICLYTDYFEASLDISRDIITAAAKARNLKFLEDTVIEIDKNAKFHYNLFNLDFVSLKPKVAETFYQVRRWLLMVKNLGLRAYVTGIMSPYVPHKAAFYFENAPAFLQAMGWHSVRLNEVEQVLSEMNLVISYGPKRVDANLLQLAASRRAYFRLYYMLTQDERKKVQRALTEFVINHHSKYFPEMTIIQQLVELALPIEKAAHDSSGAQETWLIRTAIDYLRTYAKQERPREDIISKISGEIYRKMRREYVADKLNSIENFATAVYDLLYVEAWKKQLPTTNVQKDWIYEFAFVFKKRSREWFDENRKKQG